MKRILFAFYPSHIKYNHGIALLSSLCKKRGIGVELCVIDTLENFFNTMENDCSDFVGFSVVTVHDLKWILPYIAIARDLGKSVLIGGTYAKWVELPFPVCRGDGETLPDFILNGDDTLFREDMRCVDLNDLPLIDYDLFADIPFKRGYGIFENNTKLLPYFSSRGCPHECSFCLVQRQVPGVRIRTKVEEDLRQIISIHHADMIFMGDALTPYYSKEWIGSWGDFRFPFFSYIRADISKENLLWLIDRGMKACSFGIESGNERYRNEALLKNLTDSDINRTVGILKKNNIIYIPFYMQFTPGETFQIRAETSKMARQVGGYPMIFTYEEV